MYDVEHWMSVLDSLRKQAGYDSYAELCRSAGIEQSNINRWREGRQPSNGAILKLSGTLAVPVRTLLIAAGHFGPADLSDGDEATLLRLIESGKLSKRQKLALMAEWHDYVTEQDAVRSKFRTVLRDMFLAGSDDAL